MKKMTAILAALLVLCVLAAPLLAQVPFRVSKVGAATLSYTNDLKISGATLFTPKFIYVSGVTTDTTATVVHKMGAITNTLCAKALSATDRMITVSNSYYVFKTDILAVTGIATDATWTVTGMEQ